jgi:nitroreductase
MRTIVVLLAWVTCTTLGYAQDLAPVALPPPQTHGGVPLMQALGLRATSRAFATDSLPRQTLSNLLWAACGINRPDSGKRTAPSARNWQEIDVYAVMAQGVYRYDPASHALQPVVAGDLRRLTGRQEFVGSAPVTLVLVADRTRMKDATGEEMESYSWADAAFVSENVYLFCASEGLATGVRAMVDRPALAQQMKLADTQSIVFAQSIGFPKK